MPIGLAAKAPGALKCIHTKGSAMDKTICSAQLEIMAKQAFFEILQSACEQTFAAFPGACQITAKSTRQHLHADGFRWRTEAAAAFSSLGASEDSQSASAMLKGLLAADRDWLQVYAAALHLAEQCDNRGQFMALAPLTDQAGNFGSLGLAVDRQSCAQPEFWERACASSLSPCALALYEAGALSRRGAGPRSAKPSL